MADTVMQRHHVTVLGSGSQTMILAHGFGTDQTAWAQQIPALAERYRLILFDLVGAGKSDLAAYTPTRYRHLNGYALDLLAICAALDLRDAIYVGHSMSAMIGMRAALVQSQRFARMIFIGASPRYLNDSGYIGGFQQTDLDELYAMMAANYQAWAGWFAPQAMRNADRPELSDAFAQTLFAQRPDIAQNTARVVFQSDERASVALLQTPTLILQSTNDLAVPVEVGAYLARTIPNSQLQIIAAEGHLPHISAPEQVNAAILAYLQVA